MKDINCFRLPVKLFLFVIFPAFFLFLVLITNFSSGTNSVFTRGSGSNWFSRPNLPFTIKYNVTAEWHMGLNKLIVLAGGRVNNIVSNNVRSVSVIDTGSIITFPSLPVPLEKAGGFIIKDSLYLIGGYSDYMTPVYRNSVYKLNLNGGTFWQQKSNIPYPLAEITYSTVTVNDSVVYIAGGKTNPGTISNSVFRYNPKNDSWSIATPLPVTVYGGALGVVTDSTLIFVGGRTLSSVSSAIYRGVINKNNPNLIIWIPIQQYPAGPVFNLGCWGTRNGHAVFSGGTNSLAGRMLDSVYGNTYFYNEGNGNITEVAIKPTPTTHTQLDGYITPGGNINTYYCYAPGGATTPSGPGTNVFQYLVIVDTISTGIHPINGEIPAVYALFQNYPNPFNPITKIKFDIKKEFRTQESEVKLVIYDILSKEIQTLVNDKLNPGTYEVIFDGSNLPSGIYFYSLSINGIFVDVKKALLIK